MTLEAVELPEEHTSSRFDVGYAGSRVMEARREVPFEACMSCVLHCGSRENIGEIETGGLPSQRKQRKQRKQRQQCPERCGAIRTRRKLTLVGTCDSSAGAGRLSSHRSCLMTTLVLDNAAQRVMPELESRSVLF